MGLFKGSLAGPGYVILNIIRVLNIVALLDIIAASVVMLLKISLVNSFFFFEAVTHAVTAIVSIIIIISELPILRGYFDRNWPLFGQESGFVTLALAMIILGVSVLGDLNNKATSQKDMGLAFWRIVASAGILAMVMGVVNFVVSFIFRDRERGVTARQVRTYGAVASKVVERKTSQRSFQLSLNRQDTLPTYTPSPRPMSLRNARRFPLKVSPPTSDRHESFPKNSSEPGLAIPDLAHHPAMMYAENV
ncbi:hypothetical protein VTN77DRAFT_6032 [Rasamsonia byssochlamydoides]|uniref:uncharacterized protein n=1 Tax=Rasamsonia byssochlamydoides TaxID=89139 RepID=UPI0037430EB8